MTTALERAATANESRFEAALPTVVPLASRARSRPRKRSRTWVLPTLITLGGFGARAVITRGLWVDEAMSVAQARLSYPAMIHRLRVEDVHPPLYHSLLWLTIRVLGDGETAVHVPSIVFGTLMVPATYLAAHEIYDRRTGLVAAAIAAIAPIAVWYSQEARMYSLVMLLGILAVWAMFRALRDGHISSWLLLGVLNAAIAWTLYVATFLVIAQQVVLLGVLLQRRHDRLAARRLLVGWLVALGVSAILVAPLLPYAWSQFNGPNYSQFSSAGSNDPSIGLYAVITNGVWAVSATTPIAPSLRSWPCGPSGYLPRCSFWVVAGRREQWPSLCSWSSPAVCFTFKDSGSGHVHVAVPRCGGAGAVSPHRTPDNTRRLLRSRDLARDRHTGSMP